MAGGSPSHGDDRQVLNDARRKLKAATAALQSLLTETRAACAVHWEDRYTNNGVLRLEDHANGEDRAG